MKRHYYINGWEESRKYFLSILGSISASEFAKLENGEVLEKDGNRFYIVTKI